MDKYKEIAKRLNENLNRSEVSTRDAGQGRKLDYVSNFYVKKRLNDVLGVGNWAYEIRNLTCVHSGVIQNNYGKEVHSASYTAQVRIVFDLGDGVKTEFCDIGFGNGTDKLDPGKCHELASKEAVSDAVKRGACNLGMSLGLSLYDKTQEFVTNAEDEPKPVKETLTKAPTPAKLDISKVLGDIAVTSKVLTAKSFITLPELKDLLKTKYGAEKKEDLNETQATELSLYLKQLLKEKSNEQPNQNQ